MLVWGSGTVLRDRVHRSRFPVLPPGIPNYSNSANSPTFSNQSAAADNCYYAHRLNKIVPPVNPEKVMQIAQDRYQSIGLHFYPEAFFAKSFKAIKREVVAMDKDERFGVDGFKAFVRENFTNAGIKLLKRLNTSFLSRTRKQIAVSGARIENPAVTYAELENLAYFITDLSIIIVHFASEKDKGREAELRIYDEMRNNNLKHPLVSKYSANTTIQAIQLYAKASQTQTEAPSNVARAFSQITKETDPALLRCIEEQFMEQLNINGEQLSGFVRGFLYG